MKIALERNLESNPLKFDKKKSKLNRISMSNIFGDHTSENQKQNEELI